MNMKKILLAAISAAVLTAFAGCEDSSSQSTADSIPAESSAPEQIEQTSAADSTDAASTPTAGGISFVCKINGTEVPIDAESDPIIAALGTPKSTFDAPSCGFSGTSYTYTYDGFEINTYPDGDINRVYSVTLTDAAVKTAEGLGVGSAPADVTAVCGEPFLESDEFLAYKGEGVDLQFFLENDAVSTVVYTHQMG